MSEALKLCRRRVLKAEKLLQLILDSKLLEMTLDAKVRAFLGRI